MSKQSEVNNNRQLRRSSALSKFRTAPVKTGLETPGTITLITPLCVDVSLLVIRPGMQFNLVIIVVTCLWCLGDIRLGRPKQCDMATVEILVLCVIAPSAMWLVLWCP